MNYSYFKLESAHRNFPSCLFINFPRKLDYDKVALACPLFSKIIFLGALLRLKVLVDAGYSLASQPPSRLRQTLLGYYPTTIRFASIGNILSLTVLFNRVSGLKLLHLLISLSLNDICIDSLKVVESVSFLLFNANCSSC